ncbi:response regulator [Cohnella sp. CFH 77786]|uniref:response regulator transcription factor n=1 Tax=Cohnella sp. CFH 77786 TaxID=2662265 RepID=UPI001C60AC60|nr:helix-turn-helix domain-containing protein [Cohnella sp. CFH 77786]MBW5445709.1 response regulator [Cohnella sp. CFH 77786]
MWKVLLADDDVPMIKYWSKRLPWKSLGFEVIGLAHSGNHALQLFRKTMPDVLITDIGMPRPDGLELASQVRALKPEVRIVFLTCHEEFGYARKALQLNAVDYLIKDELTEAILLESLHKVSSSLAEELSRKGETLYLQDIVRDREIMKRRFLHRVLTARHPEEMAAHGSRIGIRWESSRFLISLGFIRLEGFPDHYRYRDLPLLLYSVCNISEELRTDLLPVDTFQHQEVYVVCIVNYSADLRHNPYERFRYFLTELQTKTKRFLNLDVSFGRIAGFEGIGELATNLGSLKEEIGSAFYGMPEGAGEARFFASDKIAALGEDWAKVRMAFLHRNRGATDGAWDQLRAAAARMKPDPAVLLGKFSQWVRVLELDADQPGDQDFHDCLALSQTLGDAMALVKRKTCELADLMAGNRHDKPSKIVQIDRYLAERLSENISLTALADHLHLNPSYLSRYFKQETGMNFTDYVHKFKMQAACRLLKQDQHNVETIAAKLGYSERTYFSKLFKKYIGVNPKDYR